MDSDDLSEKKKKQLFEAFTDKSLFSTGAYKKAAELAQKTATIKLYYDIDDIFRREVDGLKQIMEKKKMAIEEVNNKIEELVREAEYRRYIASFENMKQNYESRKKEMAKVVDAFK